MTKGIEDLFNLPRMEDALRDAGEHPYENNSENTVSTILNDFDLEIDDCLPKDQDAVDHEKSMDRIYDETMKHATDLVEMAYNVDIPRARGMFEQANAMYSRALDAKNSKRDFQLKLLKLMLDKKKLELSEIKNKPISTIEEISQSTDSIMVEDRNTLIQMIRNQIENDKQ